MRTVRAVLASNTVDPSVLTSAERKRWDNFQRRKETVEAVLTLAHDGVSIKKIARRLGVVRNNVRKIIRGGGTDMFRARLSTLDPHLDNLDADWRGGCHNSAELWRRLRDRGFMGSQRVVTEWATRRRLQEAAGVSKRPRKPPSARQIARVMTIDRDRVPREHATIMAQIERGVPALTVARNLLDRFHAMIRKRASEELDSWIAAAKDSALSSFAVGLAADRNAVHAALVQTWSNGQTEGQITKLKLMKRQMYGRANLDLLEARLLGAA